MEAKLCLCLSVVKSPPSTLKDEVKGRARYLSSIGT